MIRLLALGLLLGLVSPLAAESFQVSSDRLAPPRELKAPFRELLNDSALQLRNAAGESVLTFWLRKAVPSPATAQQVKNGLTYREIEPTTVIGAVRIHQAWIDFRKQSIPPGLYTLRLAVQPSDGDHMGTAPHTDFCLLTPAEKDESPEPLDFKELIEKSSEATGGTHPGVLLLFPNAKPEAMPKLIDKGKGITLLTVALPIQTDSGKTTLGFAFTVAGFSDTR